MQGRGGSREYAEVRSLFADGYIYWNITERQRPVGNAGAHAARRGRK
jgi:hypothetical protein